LQGGTEELAAALRRGDLEAATVEPAERVLLEYVRKLTLTPARMTDGDAGRLRSAGWSDPQIAEAVYITALFAFFNRVADAFGLDDPGYGTLPTPDRPS
jgi:alkylhydroperoxidase family enzyme